MNKNYFIPVYGLALLVAIVLSGVLAVSYPDVWNPTHRYVMDDNFKERGAGEKLRELIFTDAEKVSGGLWNEKPYLEISRSLKFRKMGEREISHFEDVRGMMDLAMKVCAIAASVAVIGFLYVGCQKVWNAAIASFVLLGLIAGVWMAIHWHSLFRALHWVIFRNDSWILPDGCYSLVLFPHKVWKTAGGMLAVYVIVVFVVGLVVQRVMKKS